MRNFLTTGLFSAILGIVIGGAPADAALVSRGFLDEALENYATTTALDLKANQSDFTDLNTEISGSVDVLRQLLEQGGFSYELVNSIDPEKFPNTISGASFLLYQYLESFAGSVLQGWMDSNGTYYAGFVGLNNGWTDSEKKTYLGVKGLNDKIGTLPSGNFPGFPESENLFSQLRQPLTYPTSLAELITAIYGNSETNIPGLLAAIIMGFPIDTDGDGINDSTVGTLPNSMLANANATKIGTVPDGKNLAGMISATDAKIGDLPTEYTTVGAALTAIKGIAEEAKAAALSAIPDPKAEGSTGKFVLTVDIVGDNATYRWEKIDREGEATTTE